MGSMYPEDYRARELAKKHGIDLETAKRIQQECYAGVREWFLLGMASVAVMTAIMLGVIWVLFGDTLQGYCLILLAVLGGSIVFWWAGAESE